MIKQHIFFRREAQSNGIAFQFCIGIIVREKGKHRFVSLSFCLAACKLPRHWHLPVTAQDLCRLCAAPAANTTLVYQKAPGKQHSPGEANASPRSPAYTAAATNKHHSPFSVFSFFQLPIQGDLMKQNKT